MGLFAMAFAGGCFILIGAWESLSSSSPSPPNKPPSFSKTTLLATFSLSLLFFLNSLLSLFDATSSHDTLGSTLQLPILSISSFFLLFSLLGLFTSFPQPLLNLILLFAFLEEFLIFHLHLKDDTSGIEIRYYELMLVPILICIIATAIELISDPPNSGGIPKIGRGLGLILKGTWFVQMGFSFFTDSIANNCLLKYKSRGNYTITCKGHMDAHRGGAIAVLLFNCHLAFLVALICGVYSVVGRSFVVARGNGGYSNYRPLGVELGRTENQGRFTLDSDSDDGGIDGVKVEDGTQLIVNGHGSLSVS